MAELLLSRFMPAWSLREVDHISVAAPPAEAWPVARGIDLARIPFVRWLFEMRLVPERLRAILTGHSQPDVAKIGVEAVTAHEDGFALLGEEKGREVVVGAIGKFWQPLITWAPATPDTFASFNDPGWGKVAWCIRVDPREHGGSWITVEVRVAATDAPSKEKFERYWKLIGRFSRAIRLAALRVLRIELGRPARASVEGDDLLPRARYVRTHHAFLEAPPDKVWPWLVQMGCRRAGWYSHDLLDNGGVKSATKIVPELQNLNVGDIVPARPKDQSGFAVLRMERARALVLGSPELLPTPKEPAWPAKTTWAFKLEPVGPEATLLSVRVRADYAPTLKAIATRLGASAAHEIMQSAQLTNLKARVEARS